MSKTADASSSIYFDAVERFVSGNYALCIDDFLRLSSVGDARATLYAATIFDRGGGGVDQDWERARDLYKQSLKQSYLPGAALGLALMFYKGRGGAQDFYEASKYFGMIRDNAFSQIMLGVMSLKGKGRVVSEDEALSYFDKAWTLGHPLGLKNAAIIRFHRGQYVRSAYDFLRSSYLIFWNYGIKQLPLVKSPSDCAKKQG